MSVYDVRIHAILENTLAKKRKSYTVRWKVAATPFRDTFATRALAESFRSKLIVAQREGVAFDGKSGLPEPMARELNAISWYDLAVSYVDMKWARAAATQRKSVAESLAFATLALLKTDRGAPDDNTLRLALYRWSFNKAQRNVGEPPLELSRVVAWVERNTVPISELKDAGVVRKALDRLAILVDGRAAAANTIARKRAIFYGALKYAVELRHLETHPMDYVQWKLPKSAEEVDPKVVVNAMQARRLLAAVAKTDPQLEGFFACMYFAAMRPSEVAHLREDECELPTEGWGWLHLSGSTQHVGGEWSDSGENREDRELKHRAKSATRDVPACPELVAVLRRHLAEKRQRGGRMFHAARAGAGPVTKSTYLRAWRGARRAALTPVQQASPLASRPYDLRHAAVSLWLNAGVPATQVAQWAGHSVHVLLKVYASCVYGQDEAARRRIESALGEPPTVAPEPPPGDEAAA
ncbi:integrase [Pilimelia terevasa]|uniref:Integrase n=1 Tax=Pilimelia terevasa TaxID=53372 RepID=A0A8J3BV53_9ACTN|nr:tyrosine-type recombinase/integrase [Pilimelia terevasa]GGK32578.1 integrase [Pilimelia terevasa]